MKLFFTSFFLFFCFLTRADNIISGNNNVVPNAVEIYTVNWDSWGSVYENYSNVQWTVTNGTVISSDKHTVTVQWDDIPNWLNATGSIDVYDDLGGQSGNIQVDIVNFLEGTSAECTGVLGAPAVFIDFSHGSNPGPPLPAGSITYNYSSSCIINSGKYAISNSTVGCNGSWLGLTQDHTPNDVNGYMLMVDGDDHRGEVYRSLVSGLTSAFKYEMSVYIANLADGYQKPRINFEIRDLSNNLIQKSGSYTIPFDGAAPWKKVSFMFDLPLGSSSVYVVLVNDHNDESGNDFVVDDISFAPCYPPILASFSSSSIVDKSYICNNGTVNLYSRWPTPSIPYTNPGFKWQKSSNNGITWIDIPGATTMNFTQTEAVAGLFQYRMYAYETAAPSQFVVSNAISYFVQKMVVEAKTHNVFACNPNPVQLNPTYYVQYADPYGPALTYTYLWSPGTYLSSTTIATPNISLPALPPPAANLPPPPPINYSYSLTVTNNNFAGCVATGTQTVSHYNPRKVAVPSAFTPDLTTNNLFRPINLDDYPGGKFWVNNRWGQNVFYSEGPTLLNYSWNGKYQGIPQEQGNYVWIVQIPGCPTNILNGGTGTNVPNGNVLLIR